MNPWLAVIGAALGAMRASKEQEAMNKQRNTEVSRELWSPWTGQHGKDVGNADYMGRIMEGGTAGLMMGQSMGDKPKGMTKQNVPISGQRLGASSQATMTPNQKSNFKPNMYAPEPIYY